MHRGCACVRVCARVQANYVTEHFAEGYMAEDLGSSPG